MKTYKSLTIFLLILTIVLVGCAPKPTLSLTGTVWKWQQTQIPDGSISKPQEPTNYTIEFKEDGQLAVLADCNRVTGQYTVDGNQIKIELGVTTMMACPSGSLDAVFSQQLGSVVSYFFKDGHLYMDIKFDSGTMEFAP